MGPLKFVLVTILLMYVTCERFDLGLNIPLPLSGDHPEICLHRATGLAKPKRAFPVSQVV